MNTLQRVSYKQTLAILTSWKKQEDLDFLTLVISVPFQQSLRHLQDCFHQFFLVDVLNTQTLRKSLWGGSAEFTLVSIQMV